MELLQPVDPNERCYRRRRLARRRMRVRRAVAGLALVGLAAGFAFGAHSLRRHAGAAREVAVAKRVHKHAARPLPSVPAEIRGIHVSMQLLTLPGELGRYLALKSAGLNTIELDVKDELGNVAFSRSRRFYDPRLVAREAHAAGMYLIGRVVTFEDPALAAREPQLALKYSDGTSLGWVNPYDKRSWSYAVSIGAAAARAGFDEIQFDYVRFPSGNVSSIVYPTTLPGPKTSTIARFAKYAAKRLHRFGVRVSVDVFGLAATRDLGIGQKPAVLAHYVDTIYPMVYPSQFNSGEYGLSEPSADPRTTVTDALLYFDAAIRGTKAHLVPWLQDFSHADAQAQIDAARSLGTNGFLLWNPLGVYTTQALQASSP